MDIRREINNRKPTTSSYLELRPLNLLCTFAALDIILETSFIRDELLGGLGRPLKIQPFDMASDIPFMNDALFLVLNEDLVGNVREAIQRGCRNIGVFHMGDELHKADHSYYDSVDYVLRNYHREDLPELQVGVRCRGIVWVPNGYRYGVGPRNPCTLVPHQLRENLLFFAGCLSTGGIGIQERLEMFDTVQTKNLPATIITSKGFGKGLCAGAYAALMENSKFALVPSGRCAETIRLYDALEMGAIPISLRHGFLGPNGPMTNSPFVFLDAWQDLPAWLAANTGPNHEAKNVKRQQDCLAWWSDLKQKYRNQVADLIESSFAKYSS